MVRGTGKTRLASAITANVVRDGARRRYFNTVDLVNRLEEKTRLGKAGTLAAQLSRLEVVVLDELGYLLFTRSGGHPWSFDTEILNGGYVEEVFHLDLGGGWHSELVHRLPGETYHIDAAHIHRIVELPTGECWPLFRVGPHAEETRFWRFGDMIRSLAWLEGRWARHA